MVVKKLIPWLWPHSLSWGLLSSPKAQLSVISGFCTSHRPGMCCSWFDSTGPFSASWRLCSRQNELLIIPQSVPVLTLQCLWGKCAKIYWALLTDQTLCTSSVFSFLFHNQSVMCQVRDRGWLACSHTVECGRAKSHIFVCLSPNLMVFLPNLKWLCSPIAGGIHVYLHVYPPLCHLCWLAQHFTQMRLKYCLN